MLDDDTEKKTEEEEPKEEGKDTETNLGSKSVVRTNGQSSSAHKGGNSVKRMLIFDDHMLQADKEENRCLSLLQAMELDDSVEVDMDNLGLEELGFLEKEDMLTLPEEWVTSLSQAGECSFTNSKQILPQEKGSKDEVLGGQVNFVLEEELESNLGTQPTKEDIGKLVNQRDVEKGKSKGKGKVWGPVIAQRRSQRILDDGRTMTEKAQELKKKSNLEIPKGITKIPSISRASLLSVATEIGLVVEDGNPSNSSVLDNMLAIDKERHTLSVNSCPNSLCSVNDIPAGSSDQQMDRE